jgi:hypothetical protein
MSDLCPTNFSLSVSDKLKHVAHFNVAHFNVAHFNVAHFHVAHFHVAHFRSFSEYCSLLFKGEAVNKKKASLGSPFLCPINFSLSVSDKLKHVAHFHVAHPVAHFHVAHRVLTSQAPFAAVSHRASPRYKQTLP